MSPRRVRQPFPRAPCQIGAFDGYSVVYGLFSVSGFDETLMNDADVVLVDKRKY